MESEYLLETLDTHTGGEPTRIITGGFRWGRSFETSIKYRQQFEQEFDWIRRALMKEPRGHANMFGAVPVELEGDHADLGLFFMDNEGYLDMCGHGTMGVITALIETGRLNPKEEITVETPAGLVEARPSIEEGEVTRVGIKNVSSYYYKTTAIKVPEIGEMEVHLVYAGNLFAMVNTKVTGLEVSTKNTTEFIDHGLQIRRTVNEEVDLQDPFTGEPREVELTEFYQPGEGEDIDKNITVFADGQVDRSPCGTGTCAKLALLHHQGQITLGVPYPHESVIGTRFEGEITDVTTKEDQSVITPEVRGSAYLTGKHSFFVDPSDQSRWFDIEVR